MTRIVRLSQTEIEKETGIKEAFRTSARGITRTELRDGPFDNLRHLKGARGWQGPLQFGTKKELDYDGF